MILIQSIRDCSNNPIKYFDPTGYKQIKKGDKGDGVKAIQEMLNKAGFNCGATDGSFGPKTQAALKAFQKTYGLKTDGVVGNQSLTALQTVSSVSNAPDSVRKEALKSISNIKTGDIKDNTILMSIDKRNAAFDNISTLQKATGGGTVKTAVVGNQIIITEVTVPAPVDKVNPKKDSEAPKFISQDKKILTKDAFSSHRVDLAVDVILPFVAGVSQSIDNNMLGGTTQFFVNGGEIVNRDDNTVFKVGNVVGDLLSVAGSSATIITGWGIGSTGGVATVSSGGALSFAGVPAIAAGGAIATYGTASLATSLDNFNNNFNNLINSNGGTGKSVSDKYPWSELPTSGERPFEPPVDKSGNPILKKGPNNGMLDKYGNEWFLDKTGAKVGNPHWDVQHPNGSHTNVNPQSNNPGGINHGSDNFKGGK